MEKIRFDRAVDGYNRVQVDRFIEKVELEYKGLLETCKTLEARCETQNTELKEMKKQVNGEVAAAVMVKAEMLARHTKATAEKEADEIKAMARGEAEEIKEAARKEVNEITTEAEQRLKELRQSREIIYAELTQIRHVVSHITESRSALVSAGGQEVRP